MRVFVANFGQSNYLWPKCLTANTVATLNHVKSHSFWARGDRAGFVEHAVASLKTANMEAPVRAVASRWYGLNDAIAATSGDLWIHKEKDKLWWTTSRAEPAKFTLAASINVKRDGPEVMEIHKPAEPWSSRDRRGRSLVWNSLHPKAQDFLTMRGTLHQLSPDNSYYAIALIDGDVLDVWHGKPNWKDKIARIGRNPVTVYDAKQKTIYRMVQSVFSTVMNSNGQQSMRILKNKDTSLSESELGKYIEILLKAQDGRCAITNLPLHFDENGSDTQLRCSVDRIDSSGHYDLENLQIVCWFVNRWKSDSLDQEFRRLIDLVRVDNL